MWTSVKWEWRKQTRQARFWGSLVALAILGFLFTYGYSQMSGNSSIAAYVGHGLADGFFVPILALIVSTSILLPFFVTLLGSDSVSGERQSGTWEMLLAQGVSPGGLWTAKWIVGLGYVFLLTGTLVLASLAGGYALFGLHASALPSGIEASFGTFWHVLAIMAVYTMAGQSVVMTMAVTVSAFVRHTLSALMITMGSLIVLAMLGDWPFLTWLRPLSFTSYFARLSAALSFPINWSSMIHGGIVYALYTVVFLGIILWFEPFRD